MMIRNVGQLLEGKAASSVSPVDSVETAAVTMSDADERAVAVVENRGIVGILSERDIVQSCVAKQRDPGQLAVSEIMTRDPVTIDESASLAEAIEKMIAGRFHHLPVVRSGIFIGMVYTDDIPEEYRALLEHFKELKAGA